MKKITLIFGLIAWAIPANACIDCTGTGSNINFTGIITASTGSFGTLLFGNSTSAVTGSAYNLHNSTTDALLGVLDSRPFTDIIVGTAGTKGIDATVTSLEQFNLVLASFNARGLTYSTTVQGTIHFRNGLYNLSGATVPHGINVVCSDSVTFQMTGITGNIMTIYGTVGMGGGFPCIMDAGNQAFIGRPVSIRGSAQVNLTLVGGAKQANAVDNCSFVDVQNSTRSGGSLWFKDFTTVTGFTSRGWNQTFYVNNSTDISYFVRSSTFVPNNTADATGAFSYIANCLNCDLTYDAEDAKLNWVLLDGNLRNVNIYGRISVSTGHVLDDAGIVGFLGDSTKPFGNPSSTSTVKIDVTVLVFGVGTANAMNIFHASDLPNGIVVNGVEISGRIVCYGAGNNVNAVRLGSTDYNRVNIHDLIVNGCLGSTLVDSATNTLYQIYKDGALVTNYP